MTTETIDIQASTGEPNYTYGKAIIHHFNKNEKIQRALKKMAMFWGASLLAILLPVVHFVLVPLLFVLGIFFFFQVMKTDGEVLGGNITCPSCQTEATLQPDLLQWPLKEICQNCARVLRINQRD